MDKYDENAFVQRITAEKLVSSLSQKKFDKILEIGCGTGILTKQIEQNLGCKISYTQIVLFGRCKACLEKNKN